MEDLPIPQIVAGVSALVGILCLWLAVVALRRRGKAKEGGAFRGETPADLRNFALKQGASALVMFALAGIILFYAQ